MAQYGKETYAPFILNAQCYSSSNTILPSLSGAVSSFQKHLGFNQSLRGTGTVEYILFPELR